MMIVFCSSVGDEQHASSRRGPLSHEQWCLQWLLALVSQNLSSSSIFAAAVDAESVQHISRNLLGDLFGVAGLKQDGHAVFWLLMVHVDFSFEQESS